MIPEVGVHALLVPMVTGETDYGNVFLPKGMYLNQALLQGDSGGLTAGLD